MARLRVPLHTICVFEIVISLFVSFLRHCRFRPSVIKLIYIYCISDQHAFFSMCAERPKELCVSSSCVWFTCEGALIFAWNFFSTLKSSRFILWSDDPKWGMSKRLPRARNYGLCAFCEEVSGVQGSEHKHTAIEGLESQSFLLLLVLPQFQMSSGPPLRPDQYPPWNLEEYTPTVPSWPLHYIK
jgi:hypothetical protein